LLAVVAVVLDTVAQVAQVDCLQEQHLLTRQQHTQLPLALAVLLV
jgi:hypothetical protein